jgi:predicted nucleotidyltransferase/predicted transcriptional regulator
MVNETNQLLMYLFSKKEDLVTIREISINLNIPYMTLSRLIKKLSKQELVEIKKKGSNYLCKINLKYSLLKHYLIISSEEISKDYLSKQPIISMIKKIFIENNKSKYSAVLFGSYAKNKQEKHSDIDIMFISEDKKGVETIKKEIAHYEKLYEVEINYLIFTPRQFNEMMNSSEENVGKQILKNNIILHNPELFWEVVFDGL